LAQHGAVDHQTLASLMGGGWVWDDNVASGGPWHNGGAPLGRGGKTIAANTKTVDYHRHSRQDTPMASKQQIQRYLGGLVVVMAIIVSSLCLSTASAQSPAISTPNTPVAPTVAAVAPQGQEDPPAREGIYPMPADWRLLQVEKSLAAGQFLDALDMIDLILKRNPRAIDGHLYQGYALLRLEKYDMAEAALTRVTTLDHKHLGALYLLGALAMERRDPKQAQNYLGALAIACGGDLCEEHRMLQRLLREERLVDPKTIKDQDDDRDEPLFGIF
jgi:hypothetical protein